MSLVDFEYRGRTVRAIEIGHFVVCVCCNKGDGDLHAIIHKATGETMLCGLSQEAAVRVADTAAAYLPDCPNGPPPISRSFAMWAVMTIKGSIDVGYAEFAERIFGNRPKPTKPPAFDRESVAEMLAGMPV